MLAATAVFGLIFSTPAMAVSCSEQGGKCANGWAVGQYASYKSACIKEIAACKVRCKQGNKYYVGVLVANHYPIDTCN